MDEGTLCIIAADGGPSQALTDLTVMGFRWAPDSTTIAVIAPTECAATDGPHVLDCDADSTQLWLVDLGGGSRRLTSSALFFDARAFDWSPDGRMLVVTCRLTARFNDFARSTLHLVDTASGEMRSLVDGMVSPTFPYFSPEGEYIGFIASDDELPWAFVSRTHQIALVDHDVRALAATPDEALQYAFSSRGLLGWDADGKALYAIENRGTQSALYWIPANGEAVAMVMTGWVLSGAHLSADGTKIACVAQNLDHPPEVAVLDLGSNDLTIVSAHNQYLKSPTHTEVIRWTSEDGFEIEGLLTYPEQYEPGAPSSLIVMVHGGPGGVWSEHFLRSAYPDVHPVTALAHAGYAVLQPNIRGSQGYGRNFRFANFADWGGGDFQDMMNGVDYVIGLGVADPDRLGVMGWSYGGYMSAWAITQTDRFKAASVGAPVTNLISFIGTSDIPDFIPCFYGAELWEDPSLLMDHSPLYHVGNVTTPTLLLHGEDDTRSPPSQSYEFYTQLKCLGIPTQMVVYPRSGHLLQEPALCDDLAERNMAWFNTYLNQH